MAASALALVLAAAAQAITPDEANTIAVFQRAQAAVVNITNYAVAYDYFLNPVPSEASGSGVILDRRGYILTNNHVVANARRLVVKLADKSRWPARLVGRDPESDLAVIKIEAPPQRLATLPFGDSDRVKVGQKVIAIGNPFGLEHTLTTGVVSAIRRRLRIQEVELERVIQTDAAINPGNSGGPLLDSQGRLIGINTAIFSPSGASAGIGFAIPANTARRVARELIARGYVARPWLGVGRVSVYPDLAQALGLPADQGALIVATVPGGPADRAGLRGGTRLVEVGNVILRVGGDLVVSVDGRAVDSAETLIEIVKSRKVGETLRLRAYRGRRLLEFTVRLAERPRR